MSWIFFLTLRTLSEYKKNKTCISLKAAVIFFSLSQDLFTYKEQIGSDIWYGGWAGVVNLLGSISEPCDKISIRISPPEVLPGKMRGHYSSILQLGTGLSPYLTITYIKFIFRIRFTSILLCREDGWFERMCYYRYCRYERFLFGSGNFCWDPDPILEPPGSNIR
jgi:hypothetical protein